jgi:hypothetical protein
MRDTWTLAVFSEMKSDAPISRFVCPSATRDRTVSSAARQTNSGLETRGGTRRLSPPATGVARMLTASL